MAGTIVVDRIESDASYASTINVAGQITFSNTVNFGVYSGTAPVAGFYLPSTNNVAFTTASTERMRIDSSGNVGIGTSSPIYKLDARAPSGIGISFIENTSGNTNRIQLGASSGLGYINADAGTGSVAMALQVAGSTKATLDQSGNLGLGVTPSATASAYYRSMEIGLGTVANVGIVGGDSSVGSNYYLSAASTYAYKFTGAATRYQFYNGVHSWSYAASGTAGNPITWTQAMTLDASGNVGIGTSAPSSVNKLEITNGSTATNCRLAISNSAGYGAYVAGTTNNREFLFGSFGSVNGFGSSAWGVYDNTAPSWRLVIDNNGYTGVGTTSPSSFGYFSVETPYNMRAGWFYVNTASSLSTPAASFVKKDNNTTTSQVLVNFYVNGSLTNQGQINANGASAAAFGSFSDRRLKENITELAPQLSNIMALRPVEFDYIESEGGSHQIGFIAQEVQEIYPDLVGEREDGMLTLTDMNKNDARLIKAIQELKQIVDAQAVEIAALKEKLA